MGRARSNRRPDKAEERRSCEGLDASSRPSQTLGKAVVSCSIERIEAAHVAIDEAPVRRLGEGIQRTAGKAASGDTGCEEEEGR
jgi:hypothetical protein